MLIISLSRAGQNNTKDNLSKLINQEVERFSPFTGGRNSKVYRIILKDCPDNYILKIYFQGDKDKRDRFSAELNAYRFLWKNDISVIPRLIKADREKGYALYQHISGGKIAPAYIGFKDIDQAVNFLKQLRRLALKTDPRELPVASEAFFTVPEVLTNLEDRYLRLERNKVNKSLDRFLESEFKPVYSAVINDITKVLSKGGSAFSEPLTSYNKTISPSDFGFHNAIKTDSGKIYFFDFEYFGWDDPAKTIVDFILHPAMQLSSKQSRYFYSEALKIFNDVEKLQDRVNVVFPLYTLKWVLIILNEFLPEQIERRKFAGDSLTDISTIQEKQLYKARQMLKKVVKKDG